MSVVTVSRGSFSGGKMLAECLAENLGYRCIDRDVIVEKAAASGVSQDELRDALEKPPTFLDRFKHKKYVYLTLIQSALTEEVRTGRAVYHGNAGHLLLKGGGPILRCRIIAPLELRIGMARHRLKFGREEAIAYIQKMDDQRRKWTQYLYGVNWEDPSLYDVVINLENVDIKDACEAISTLVRRQACFEFDAHCQAAMDDLALASRVKSSLALNPATSHLEFDVVANTGSVILRGRLSSMDLLSEVERVTKTVPGVIEVDLDHLTSMTHA
jgi:cytidylate kinase